MSGSEFTRVIRLRADVERGKAPNAVTRCTSTGSFRRVTIVNHRAAFIQHQFRLSQIVREYGNPGLAVVALHNDHGIGGHVWLQATDQVRAGTVGRHSHVDLHLPDDDELSLRHLLVLVQRLAGEVSFRVADLATGVGFQAETGQRLNAITANAITILQVASYSLVLIPTGAPLPWDPHAADPWSTLPPRILLSEERQVDARPLRSSATHITVVAGLAEIGRLPDVAQRSGEPLRGHIVISSPSVEQRISVGTSALERGIIVGRYPRCTGDTTLMTQDVSRVHAVLLLVQDMVHIIDAGSSNGIVRAGEEIKCEPMLPGHAYAMGETLLRWDAATPSCAGV